MRRPAFLVCLLLALLALPTLAGPLEDARALVEDSRYEDARPLLERLLEAPATRGEALLLLTRVCNVLEDHKAGTKHGKQLVKVLPESSDAHLQYAVALRIKMGAAGPVKAMFTVGSYKKQLKKSLALSPDNLEAREEEIGFFTMAPGIAGGDKKKAAERTADLKRLDWRRGTRFEAVLAAETEEYDRAFELYDELLERHPDDEDARREYAYGLQRRERWLDADRQFAILAGSDDPQRSLGALYQQARTRILGSFESEQAVDLLNRFVAARPENDRRLPSRAAAHWRMGMAYEQLGRTAEARGSYRKALELDDDMDEARKALRKLNKG